MRSATRKKTGRDPLYLKWLHTLPCLICFNLAFAASLPLAQLSQTEAAHVGDRGLSQKAPDRTAIPLCAEHHRLDRFSAHRMGKKFWQHYGLDRDAVVAGLNTQYQQLRAA